MSKADERDLFILSDQTLNTVVSQIKDEQWEMIMPPESTMTSDGSITTLRDIINGHAYDDAWVPDMLAGKTIDEAGKDKFSGDLLGSDPQANFAAIVEKACLAAKELPDLERIIHYSYGDFPAKEALWHAIIFRGMRSYDIAKAIGIPSELPEELTQGLWEIVEPHAEEWRAMGIFGPAVSVPETAPTFFRLLGLTGRNPQA